MLLHMSIAICMVFGKLNKKCEAISREIKGKGIGIVYLCPVLFMRIAGVIVDYFMISCVD